MKIVILMFGVCFCARAIEDKPRRTKPTEATTTTTQATTASTPAPSLDEVVREDLDSDHAQDLFTSNEMRFKLTRELIEGKIFDKFKVFNQLKY